MKRLNDIRTFLLDMDGTLHLGDTVYPGAIDFTEMLIKSGRRLVYLTNNSSRSADDYIERMRRWGFPCDRENIVTSGMAAGEQLRGQRVALVGTQALETELTKYYDIEIAREISPLPDALLIGFDRELLYEKLDLACRLLRRGVPFYAANPDAVCPMPGGDDLPDCGSICALLTHATGRVPEYIGKPNRAIVDMARGDTPAEYTAMVGDRLYTDIAAGKNAGAVSILVLSGETTRAMLDESEIKPDYVFEDVAGLGACLHNLDMGCTC